MELTERSRKTRGGLGAAELVGDPTAPLPARVAGALPVTKWSRGRALCALRVAQVHPSLPIRPEARCVAIFISRPNHLAADELVALDSGHHRPYNHPHSLRRRLAVRTRPVPLDLVPYGRNPPLSRAAPPRKRTRRRLNAGRLMWHAWGPPPGSLPVGLGAPTGHVDRGQLR